MSQNQPPIGPQKTTRRDWLRDCGRAALGIWGGFTVSGAFSGCTMVPVTVSNPVPGLTTVGVAPFFNLSSEATVDGRRVAGTYFAELQKIGGYQVIPVGVVEQALRVSQLSLETPGDAIALAGLLDADAIVVGGITDYSPYYPPRVGLQIQWYSGKRWEFCPGIPAGDPQGHPGRNLSPVSPSLSAVRGQSPDDGDPLTEEEQALAESLLLVQGTGKGSGRSAPPARPGPWPSRTRESLTRSTAVASPTPAAPEAGRRPLESPAPGTPTPEPLMSYTRLFDGADPQLIRDLQHYVKYRGDLRSGGWEAHLHRSEDFLRFVAHRMIVEMLALHGGVPQTETVWLVGK